MTSHYTHVPEFKFLGIRASPTSPAIIFHSRAEAESAAQPARGTQTKAQLLLPLSLEATALSDSPGSQI